MVRINKANELYLHLVCERSLAYELYEEFSFHVPGYQHMPKYKNGIWDGQIHLFNLRNNTFPIGLLGNLIRYLQKYDVSFTISKELRLVNFQDELEEFKTNIVPEFVLEPYDYQLESFEKIIKLNKGLVLSPTGCHAKDDKILMADASIKNIQDIQIGDFVIGADGTPKQVLRLFTGKDRLYKIQPKRSRQGIIVTKDHILCLVFTNEGKQYQKYGTTEFISVEDYISRSKWYKHISKLYWNNKELEFTTVTSSILSSYFIGLYLGDGHVDTCAITNQDKECIDACINEATKFGMKLISKGITHKFRGAQHKRNIIFKEFENLGIVFGTKNTVKCDSKFIPEKCFTFSIKERYELLAGLIDSDGCLSTSKTYYDLMFKSFRLRNDTARLATSLGFVCTFSSKQINNQTYFRCLILGDIQRIPVKIPKKQTNQKRFSNSYHSGFDIVECGYADYFGIQVEDSLYLTETGMVTHNSGKSFIIYMLLRFFIDKVPGKILISVPSINLVKQMHADFCAYEDDDPICSECHELSQGASKETDKKVVIGTWNMLYRQDAKFFKQFDVFICDEAHQADSMALGKIINKLLHVTFRFGFTGTLDGSKTHEMQCRAWFGTLVKSSTTKYLMDQGILSDMRIRCISLKYPTEECKIVSKLKYQDEIKSIVGHEKRNEWLVDLALSREQNTLLLFNFVEKHGERLFERAKEKAKQYNKEVRFITGNVDGNEREEIRQQMERQNNIVLFASFGTLSVGVNIKNIHYVIFAHPYKARIRTLQSIGRALRKLTSKKESVIIDIIDNFCYKRKQNTVYRHGVQRLEIYESEQFKVDFEEIFL